MSAWTLADRMDDSHQSASPKDEPLFGWRRRRVSVPQATMREVARRYGWEPGKTVECPCHHCGAPGKILGHTGHRGGPTKLAEFTHQIDHILPWSRGGTNDASNLVPSCRRCNLRKMAKV